MPPRRSATTGCASSSRVLRVPPLAAPLRRLIEWTADYYLAPARLGAAHGAAGGGALDGAATMIEYRLTGACPRADDPATAQALERIGDRQGLMRELARIAGVSDGVHPRAWSSRARSSRSRSISTSPPAPIPISRRPSARADQQRSGGDSCARRSTNAASRPVLLDGVTGSGKTEVYFEAIAEALREGRQALVLLPEIALTEPFLQALRGALRREPVAWHSGLASRSAAAPGARSPAARRGSSVGARSALFLPYRQARPDRRRRGARDQLQAGGRRAVITPATWR